MRYTGGMSDNGTLAGFQRRALDNLTGRHTRRAKAEAERVREYAGWLIRDLDAGRLPNHHARDLLASAQEIVARLSALEAIGETTGILVPEDKEGEGHATAGQ